MGLVGFTCIDLMSVREIQFFISLNLKKASQINTYLTVSNIYWRGLFLFKVSRKSSSVILGKL